MVYPLLVRDCPWQEVQWLARLQIRPSDGKPVASRRGESRTECLANVAREIADIVKGNKRQTPSRPAPALRSLEPSTAPTSDTQVIRLNRVMPLLEQLTECVHSHRMMFSNYTRAMLNKSSLDDEFESRRLELDKKAVQLVSKLLIYLPTQFRWTITRLRRVTSCSWQHPRDLYYVLLEACGSFPRAPIEAAGRLYDDLMQCYLEMGSLYFEQRADGARYDECLKRHWLGEAARSMRDDANSEAGLKLILEHEYYGSEDKANALARCKV